VPCGEFVQEDGGQEEDEHADPDLPKGILSKAAQKTYNHYFLNSKSYILKDKIT